MRLWAALLAILLFAGSARPQGSNDAILRALSQKQFDVALKAVDDGLKSRPADARLWMLRGAALSGLQRVKEALAAYRKALEIQPTLVPALEASAQIEYNTKDPNAGRTLAKILAIDPANAVAHAMAGVLAYEAKDCDGAIRHFGKAAQMIAADKTSMHEYGSCLLETNRAREAVPVFQTLLSMDPSDARVRLSLVLALAGLNQPAQAIEVLMPMTQGPRPDADVLGLLAELYRSNQQVDQAVAAFRRGIEIHPKEERLYIGLAALCAYYNSGELGLEIVGIGLRNIPDSSRLYAMRGVLDSQMGRSEEAMADFARASDLSPVERVGTAGVALSLLQEGRTDELIAVVRERLRKSPADAGSLYLLAQGLLRKGARPGDAGFSEARGSLEKAVKLEPKFDQALALLGKLYLDLKMYDPALRELELALKLRPDNRVAMYQLMLAYAAAGRNEDSARTRELLQSTLDREREEEMRRNQIRLTKAPDR